MKLLNNETMVAFELAHFLGLNLQNMEPLQHKKMKIFGPSIVNHEK